MIHKYLAVIYIFFHNYYKYVHLKKFFFLGDYVNYSISPSSDDNTKYQTPISLEGGSPGTVLEVKITSTNEEVLNGELIFKYLRFKDCF